MNFVFSMIVPFQMVMFTMSKIANVLRLDNPFGLVLIYLGFGAGLSVFMFSGFIKTVPKTIEEAATIDGCNTLQVFWLVVFPVLKPTAITVAILNTMWVWNDYLLPYLVIGKDYKTIPIAVQYLKGGYGSVDMGAVPFVGSVSGDGSSVHCSGKEFSGYGTGLFDSRTSVGAVRGCMHSEYVDKRG